MANLAEQAALREMKAWRTAGWKLEAIAAEINRRGVPTKIPAGTPLIGKAGRPLIASGQWPAGNVAAVLASRHAVRIFATPADLCTAAAA